MKGARSGKVGLPRVEKVRGIHMQCSFSLMSPTWLPLFFSVFEITTGLVIRCTCFYKVFATPLRPGKLETCVSSRVALPMPVANFIVSGLSMLRMPRERRVSSSAKCRKPQISFGSFTLLNLSCSKESS